VPFTLENTGQKTNQRQTLQKTRHNPEKANNIIHIRTAL